MPLSRFTSAWRAPAAMQAQAHVARGVLAPRRAAPRQAQASRGPGCPVAALGGGGSSSSSRGERHQEGMLRALSTPERAGAEYGEVSVVELPGREGRGVRRSCWVLAVWGPGCAGRTRAPAHSRYHFFPAQPAGRQGPFPTQPPHPPTHKHECTTLH